ncbi:MAG: hypothetical protein KY476_00405 [Planctomycetes bacterium]|nr:hypothetical protein [Planctomycetota bacterium]
MTVDSLTTKDKDSFWEAVVDCLVEFHSIDRSVATCKAACLRNDLEKLPDRLPDEDELVYHDEPFDVACDIAGRQVDFDCHRREYEAILSRHGW